MATNKPVRLSYTLRFKGGRQAYDGSREQGMLLLFVGILDASARRAMLDDLEKTHVALLNEAVPT